MVGDGRSYFPRKRRPEYLRLETYGELGFMRGGGEALGPRETVWERETTDEVMVSTDVFKKRRRKDDWEDTIIRERKNTRQATPRKKTEGKPESRAKWCDEKQTPHQVHSGKRKKKKIVTSGIRLASIFPDRLAHLIPATSPWYDDINCLNCSLQKI